MKKQPSSLQKGEVVGVAVAALVMASRTLQRLHKRGSASLAAAALAAGARKMGTSMVVEGGALSLPRRASVVEGANVAKVLILPSPRLMAQRGVTLQVVAALENASHPRLLRKIVVQRRRQRSFKRIFPTTKGRRLQPRSRSRSRRRRGATVMPIKPQPNPRRNGFTAPS